MEDEILRLAALNSGNRARNYWSSEGEAALNAAEGAVDRVIAATRSTESRAEVQRAANDLVEAKSLFNRDARMLFDAFAAPDPKALETTLAALSEERKRTA